MEKIKLDRIEAGIDQLIQELNEIKSEVDYMLPDSDSFKVEELEIQRVKVYEKFMTLGKLMFDLWSSWTKTVL